MKYVDTSIVFSEIPDEVTLAINISGCPIKCPDCHSKYLWDSLIGKDLNKESLRQLIQDNEGITCVCLMGGDADISYVMYLLRYIKSTFPNLKTAWYSGQDLGLLEGKVDLKALNFLKTGPFDKRYGPLTSETTNQKFYKLTDIYGKIFLMDETSKFHKHRTIE